MSALDDYKRLWQAAFVQREVSRVAIWFFPVAVTLSFFGSSAVFVHRDGWPGLRIGVAVALAVVVVMSIVQLVPGFVLMNTPDNARLAPRMRRRMVEMIVGGWTIAGIAGLLLPIWHMAPIAVLYAMGVTATRGGGTAASAVFTCLVIACTWTWQWFSALLANLPLFAAAWIALVLLGAWIVRYVLPCGGDIHFAQRKNRVATIGHIQAIRRKEATDVVSQPIGAYATLLRRTIGSGRPGRLLMVGLGPVSHWTAGLPLCGTALIVGIAIPLLLRAPYVVGWVFALTVIWIVQLSFCGHMVRVLSKARTEGALLRLTASCPPSHELNRTLGTEMVRNGLTLCCATLGVIAAVAVCDGATRGELISLAAIAMVPVMPGIAWILRRDYSIERQRMAAPLAYFLFVLAAVVAIFVLVVLLNLQVAIGAWAWVLFALSTNAVGAVAAAARWNSMMAAPPILPAYSIG